MTDQEYSVDQLNAFIASGEVKSFSVQAVVTRVNGTIENYGTISGWHSNIFKHIILQVKIIIDRLLVNIKWPQS